MSQAPPTQRDGAEPRALQQQRELFADARDAEASLAALGRAVVNAREAAGRVGLERLLSPEQLRAAVSGAAPAEVVDPQGELRRGAVEAEGLAAAIDATVAVVIVRRCLKELEPLLPSEPPWQPEASALAAHGVDRVEFRSRRLFGEAERALGIAMEHARSGDLGIVAGARQSADEAIRLAHEVTTTAIDERRRQKGTLEEQSRRFGASSFAGQGFLVALAVLVVVYIIATISGAWILMGLPLLVWFAAAKMIRSHKIQAAKAAIEAEEAVIQKLMRLQASVADARGQGRAGA